MSRYSDRKHYYLNQQRKSNMEQTSFWTDEELKQQQEELIKKSEEHIKRHFPKYTPESTIRKPECPIATEVMQLVKTRADEGMKTYEMTLANNPATTKEWIDHTVEELLDAANYLTRLKKDL